MSKKSEAKQRQGYNPKPLAHCCRNCVNLISKFKKPKWAGPLSTYQKEHIFCGLGGFAVKAQAICNEWAVIQEI